MRLLKIGETYLNLDNVFLAKRETAYRRVEVMMTTGTRVHFTHAEGDQLWELLGEVWADERRRPTTAKEATEPGEAPEG